MLFQRDGKFGVHNLRLAASDLDCALLEFGKALDFNLQAVGAGGQIPECVAALVVGLGGERCAAS